MCEPSRGDYKMRRAELWPDKACGDAGEDRIKRFVTKHVALCLVGWGLSCGEGGAFFLQKGTGPYEPCVRGVVKAERGDAQEKGRPLAI